MNKGELAAAVADRTGLSKVDAGRAVEAVFVAISEAMRDGDEVRILGFGSFIVADRPPRAGRNPRTGQTTQIAASKQPRFRAGRGLKDALNL